MDELTLKIVQLIKQLSEIRGERLTLNQILSEFEKQHNQ